MNALLMYLSDDQVFDVKATISAIRAIPGVSNPREGTRGEIFECDYEAVGRSTIVQITPDAKTVTVDGLGDDSIKFMIELQSRLAVDLYVTDMGYDFELPVRLFSTVEEFKQAASAPNRYLDEIGWL